MSVLVNVFFSAEKYNSELKVSEKALTKKANPVAADGKSKAKVTTFTLNAFETYLKENAGKLEGVKLKFKGTLTEGQKAGILTALDALPEETKISTVFKKVHAFKEKKSCKFPFDVEANKAFIAELNKRIK